MFNFFEGLFSVDFMPHALCLRDHDLVFLHAMADSLIAVSYWMIPLALILIVRRRRDLAFPWMFSLFGLFIVGCGTTHILSVVTLWEPVYRLEALVKLLTAAVSCVTGVLLFRLLPSIQMLPSPAQLRHEIDQRSLVEADLRNINVELERRVAERTAALTASEMRFRTLAEAVPNLLWMCDREGNCTYIGRRYVEFTGMSEEDLLGTGWLRVVHPDDQVATYKAWAESRKNGQPFEAEYRLRHADGSYRWFVGRGLPIGDTNGRVRDWFGSCTDIDRGKRVEEALRQSNDDLRQFAFATAHDLQEPLRNVSTSLDLFCRCYGTAIEEGGKEQLAVAITGSRRAFQMIGDLQKFTRIAEEACPDLQITSGNLAVDGALSNLRRQILSSHASVEVPALPQVRISLAHLSQLFQNLLANSLKFAQPGVPPRIKISVEQTATEWRFSVSDNGIGFEQQYAEKIFGLFKQLHTREEYDGSGIGLTICARIVACYGGRIWAESQAGQGATFRFTLPLDGLGSRTL